MILFIIDLKFIFQEKSTTFKEFIFESLFFFKKWRLCL